MRGSGPASAEACGYRSRILHDVSAGPAGLAGPDAQRLVRGQLSRQVGAFWLLATSREVEFAHHGFPAAHPLCPARPLGGSPGDRPDPAPVHHPEPPDGLRPHPRHAGHRGGRGAPVGVVVLAGTDDPAGAGGRAAALAPGPADPLRPGRAHAGVRRAVRAGRGGHHRDRRGHRAVRGRAGPDPLEARCAGAPRGPDAHRAAGPDPGPGQAARAARRLAVRRRAPAGRGLVLRR